MSDPEPMTKIGDEWMPWSAALASEGLRHIPRLAAIAQDYSHLKQITREWIEKFPDSAEVDQAATAPPTRTPGRPTAPDFDTIPHALRSRSQWLLWKRENRPRDPKPTKVPYCVETTEDGPRLKHASTTDPATWSDFESARAAYLAWHDHGIDGIGFVFSDADPFVGIDVDHVRDPATGEIDQTVIDQAHGFGSYAEYSQSGDGIHVIAIGRKPGSDCRKGDAEMYATGRYFVMTGRHIDGTPDDVTEANPGTLEAFYETIAREPVREIRPAPKAPTVATGMSDDEIIERARAAANGAKFSSLFDAGSTAGYPSQSEADAALCALLSFWTRDAYQIDRLFKRSGLMREKWTEKHGNATYGEKTIGSALALGGETYTPTKPKRGRPPKAAAVSTADPDTLAPFTYRHPKWGISIDVPAVADAVQEKYAVVSFNGALYIYNEGMYRDNKREIEAEIKTIVRGAGTNEQLTRITREVLAHLVATEPCRDYPFNRVPNLIPVLNGVLSIDYETGAVTLLPHSPEYRFNYQMPVTYDLAADGAPMREVFASYVDADVVDVLYEIPAVALLQMHGSKPFKRSYLLQGDTNAAKTTYLEIIGRLVGEANISSASLQDLTGDRFIKGDLEGRILNIYDELKSIPLKDVGAFKALTGGFKHRIERKHANAYEGRITCVHVFSCNEPPGYPDDVEYDGAWWSRWEYINFTNVFETDRTFLDRVVTPANLSGLLNDVILAMVHIQKDGLYREPDPGRVKDAWKLSSDWFKEFLEAEMVPAGGGAVTDFDKGKLLLSFRRWCADNEKHPKKIPQSAKTFAPMVFRNRFFPRQVGRDKTWVYSGAYKWREDSKYADPFA